MGLHVEGCLIGVTKTHEGYTWRSTGNVTKNIQVTCGMLQETQI